MVDKQCYDHDVTRNDWFFHGKNIVCIEVLPSRADFTTKQWMTCCVPKCGDSDVPGKTPVNGDTSRARLPRTQPNSRQSGSRVGLAQTYGGDVLRHNLSELSGGKVPRSEPRIPFCRLPNEVVAAKGALGCHHLSMERGSLQLQGTLGQTGIFGGGGCIPHWGASTGLKVGFHTHTHAHTHAHYSPTYNVIVHRVTVCKRKCPV